MGQATGNAHIATGSLMHHMNQATDARRCKPDREETLTKINAFLNVVDEEPVHPPPKNFWEFWQDFVRLLGSMFMPEFEKYSNVAYGLASMSGAANLTIINQYPTCSICLENNYSEQNVPLMTPCGHFFHRDCVSQLQRQV